jgi:hypothetical protein
MARKKQQPRRENATKMQGFIAGAGEIVEQDINDTLRQNYMPYAMSVILSRAIPEIDGFKPSHRKLLYTMYNMNLLGSARTKSANIVGQTMKPEPARRRRYLRYDGAPFARLRGASAPVRRFRQGQLRQILFARYGMGRFALYRGEARRHLPRAVPRHRQGHRRFCRQLRQPP